VPGGQMLSRDLPISPQTRM